MPANPKIIMPQVAGSGTGATDWKPTSKPYQFSNVGFVQEIELKVPVNITVPFASRP